MCLYSRRLNDSSHCASSSLSSNKIKVHLCNREARTTVLIVDALLSNHAAFRRVICQNKRAQVWIKPRTGGSSSFKQPAETPVPQLQAERERSVSPESFCVCAVRGWGWQAPVRPARLCSVRPFPLFAITTTGAPHTQSFYTGIRTPRGDFHQQRARDYYYV